MKDLAREHRRLDDPTYDGRRLADVALVPRERRPRRAHPVEAAQQVLVAPRVEVVICMRGRKAIRAVNGKQSGARTDRLGERRDDEARRHVYAATTTRCTLIRSVRSTTARRRYTNGLSHRYDTKAGAQSCATDARYCRLPRRRGRAHVGWPRRACRRNGWSRSIAVSRARMHAGAPHARALSNLIW